MPPAKSNTPADAQLARRLREALDEVAPLASRVASGKTTEEDERALRRSFDALLRELAPPDDDVRHGEMMRRMKEVLALGRTGKHLECIAAAQALMAEQPTTEATCCNLIGASLFHLELYVDALAFYARMAKSPQHLATAKECIARLRDWTHCPAGTTERELARVGRTASLFDSTFSQAEESGSREGLIIGLLAFSDWLARLGLSQLALPALFRCLQLEKDNLFVQRRLLASAAALGNPKAQELSAQTPPVELPAQVRAKIDPFIAEVEQEARTKFSSLWEAFAP